MVRKCCYMTPEQEFDIIYEVYESVVLRVPNNLTVYRGPGMPNKDIILRTNIGLIREILDIMEKNDI